MAIKTSSFGSINWHDVLLSAIIAAATAVAATGGQAIIAWFQSTSFSFDMPTLILSGKAALAAFGGTILRALFASNRATLTNLDKSTIDDLKSGQAQLTISSSAKNITKS